MESKVKLLPLEKADREQFILDNQWAFKYGAMEEFGLRDNHYEEGNEIIARKTIEKCLDDKKAQAFRIYYDNKIAGGIIVFIDNNTNINELEILFIKPEFHSLGIGQKTWEIIEKMFPKTIMWETMTPYFETRNIHFYVNKLGFSIVEYFNKYHKMQGEHVDKGEDFDGMFKFQKKMEY